MARTTPAHGSNSPTTCWLSQAESKLLIKNKYPWSLQIGAEHAADQDAARLVYDVSRVGRTSSIGWGRWLLDLNDPSVSCIGRRIGLMQPETEYEIEGFTVASVSRAGWLCSTARCLCITAAETSFGGSGHVFAGRTAGSFAKMPAVDPLELPACLCRSPHDLP